MDNNALKNLIPVILSYIKNTVLSSVIIIYTGIFLVLLSVVQVLYLNNEQIDILYHIITAPFGGKIEVRIVSKDILQFWSVVSLILGMIISLFKRAGLLTDSKKLGLYKWFIILTPPIIYGFMILIITITPKQIYGLEKPNFLIATGIVTLMATFSGIIYLSISKFIDFLNKKFLSH